MTYDEGGAMDLPPADAPDAEDLAGSLAEQMGRANETVAEMMVWPGCTHPDHP